APISGQTMAGGDWRYYRFTIPLDAPAEWRLTFSQQLGDVVMSIRDTIPPGDGSTSSASSIDWASDYKNQGPYPNYDPAGTHTITTPPLRPGQTYYAGFRAKVDSTFTLSSAVNGGTIGTYPAINFYSGTYSATIPAGGSSTITVAAPVAATRWKHSATHASGIDVRIEQGSLPLTTGGAHYSSQGQVNSSLNQPLASWPWVPGQTYFIRFVNTTGSPLPVNFVMNGADALTEDNDNDGLPDAWEMTNFGNLDRDGTLDFDGDGFLDRDEYVTGSNPKNAASTGPRPSVARDGAGFRLTFPTVAGRSYRVLSRASLTTGTWSPVTSLGAGQSNPAAGTGGNVTITDTSATAAVRVRYFRIEVSLTP
ncbi:MAG: hypothetical protein ACOYOL_13245, partial [Chthoniobacterales bacterium]